MLNVAATLGNERCSGRFLGARCPGIVRPEVPIEPGDLFGQGFLELSCVTQQNFGGECFGIRAAARAYSSYELVERRVQEMQLCRRPFADRNTTDNLAFLGARAELDHHTRLRTQQVARMREQAILQLDSKLEVYQAHPQAKHHSSAARLAGWFFELAVVEWVLLTLTIALVFVAEALNTAIEFLADAVMPARHPMIEKSKDVAAAAVLVAAIASVVTGALLLGPRIAQAN